MRSRGPHALERYAAKIRPPIDRVYISARAAARPRSQQIEVETGLRPGFVQSFWFGLLARPMSAAAFAAATTYSGADMSDELDQGLVELDDAGGVCLTDRGRRLALALQRAIAAGAEELWERRPIATMPGLGALPRLADLLDTLLRAGMTSGGPAFGAMSPPYEPADPSSALVVIGRLGALRHHRGDAHRAAWSATGLTLDELLDLPARGQREAIEDDTNRRDAPIYDALTEDERLELLAILAALPG